MSVKKVVQPTLELASRKAYKKEEFFRKDTQQLTHQERLIKRIFQLKEQEVSKGFKALILAGFDRFLTWEKKLPFYRVLF